MKKYVLALFMATALLHGENINHEHRIGFSPSFTRLSAALSYEHIKIDSFYLAAATTFVKSENITVFDVGYNFSLSEKDSVTPSIGLGLTNHQSFLYTSSK
jgi:hypothetical protein